MSLDCLQLAVVCVAFPSLLSIGMGLIGESFGNAFISSHDGKLRTSSDSKPYWVPWPLTYLRRWIIQNPKTWNKFEFRFKLWGFLGAFIAFALQLLALLT